MIFSKFKKRSYSVDDSSLLNFKKKFKRSNLLNTLKLYILKYFPMIILFATKHFIIMVLWWFFVTIFFDHRVISNFSPTVRIWFGVPGSGKTTMCAWLSRASKKLGVPVLSNVEVKGNLKLNIDDLGTVDMSFDGLGAHVLIDEASLEFDNRNYKLFANSAAKNYFALHRHMGNRVDVFSQGYDIDKRIRDRASSSGLFHLKRLPVPGFVMYRCIKKVLFIKKDDKQMIDGFSYFGLPRVVYTRSVWDSFDTLDMSMCPKVKKQWQQW